MELKFNIQNITNAGLHGSQWSCKIKNQNQTQKQTNRHLDCRL